MSFLAAIAGVAVAAVLPATAAGTVETFVEAPGPTGFLKGTMLSPASGTGHVVLMIPGSGPTDRDGNNGQSVKASTYRLLAEGLAVRGIATVRIDKRGMFASTAATADPNAVTIADYVVDVRSWTAAIRRQTGASCVWLLGHSEGGLVALAAAKDSHDFCGLILVAAAGRPLGQILREQLRSNPANAPVLDQALAAIDALESGNRVDTTNMNPALLPLFAPPVQNFLIDNFSYDPAVLLASYAGPVLIIQGKRDIQIGEQDAQRLKAANPRAKLVLLPDTNHVLKTVVSGNRAANIATYADPSLPLAPYVVETIADFVDAETRLP
jgi:pimeloyl-ACP methyl ester carboxylesterase